MEQNKMERNGTEHRHSNNGEGFVWRFALLCSRREVLACASLCYFLDLCPIFIIKTQPNTLYCMHIGLLGVY
jgi:hypothetical protein